MSDLCPVIPFDPDRPFTCPDSDTRHETRVAVTPPTGTAGVHSQGQEVTQDPTPAEVAPPRVSRRVLLGGGLAVAAVGFLGAANRLLGSDPSGNAPTGNTLTGKTPAEGQSLTRVRGRGAEHRRRRGRRHGLHRRGHHPLGQPILSSGPAWKKDASNTAAEQAQQVGMNHDGMHFFPSPGAAGSHSGLLVLNHEHVDHVLLFPDGPKPMTPEKVDKALAAHGVSVVAVALVDGGWRRSTPR